MMRGALVLAAATLAWPAVASAQAVQAGAIQRTEKGVTLRTAQGVLRIGARSDRIVHITALRNADRAGACNLAALAPDARVAVVQYADEKPIEPIVPYTGHAIDVAMLICR